jgi:hypothetical protein
MKRFALISLMVISMGLAFALTCYDIQYTETPGPDGYYPSTYTGQTVTVTGVVTEESCGTSSSGPDTKFVISDPGGGPWSGLYVFEWGTGVQRGDMVTVTGPVYEYYGYTEISGAATTVTILSNGNQLPQPALIQTSNLSNVLNLDNEQWEGVLCKIQNVTVTTIPNNYQEFYVTDGSGPGQIDDFGYQYPHTWPTITVGQAWGQITGIFDFSYYNYSLNPRDDSDFNTTAVEDYVVLPDAKLIGNFPNPFARQTQIAFNLKSAQPVQIQIFNLKGQKVRTLVDSKMGAQLHKVNGSLLPTGMYMYKLTAGNTVQSRKLVIR